MIIPHFILLGMGASEVQTTPPTFMRSMPVRDPVRSPVLDPVRDPVPEAEFDD